MGLSVAVAPRPELILDDLAARLARPLPDPFDEDIVVVPTTGIRNWLRAELAVRLGILVRVRFVLPGTLPEVVLGREPTDDAWRVDRLAWHVLGRVVAARAEGAARPWAGRPDRPWTVAARVAELLDHYAAQRPGMLAAWARGEDRVGDEPDAAPLRPAQRWQAEAWRTLVGAVPAPAPALRLADAVAGRGSAGTSADLPSRITVVGPGSVTDHALGLLTLASRSTDVAVLAVVPRSRPDAPLAAWGARAAEVAAAVQDLATAAGDAAPHVTPAPPGSDDQLGRLRAALADVDGSTTTWARPAVPTSGRRGDGSVVIHACHGPVRQLEVARDAILHALEDDRTLLPRDVLVLCEDIAAMAPLVGPVLAARVAHVDGDTRSLAVRVVDRSVPTDDLVRLSLDRALAAAADRLTREDVEALLGMAPVRAALGLDLDDLAAVVGLFEELGVRWGTDARHRARFAPGGIGDDPTEGADDLPGDGTWRDARDRMAAGLLLHPSRDRVVATPEGPLAPARLAADSFLPVAGRVTEAVDALMGLADASGAPAPVARWARLTARLVTTLLRPTGRSTDATAWRAEADRTLDAIDAVVAAAADGGAAEVPLTLREWTRALGSQLGSGGGGVVPAAGCVQVGSVSALRGVPARVVVLVGLGDRPATASDDDDALAPGRRRGERDPSAEARAALLETVVAAGDRLIITCDGRSITTGEELPLPTVVEELCDALPDVPDGPLPLVIAHPRHLADPRALGVKRGAEEPVPTPSGTGPWTFLPSALTVLRAASDDVPPVLGTTGLVVRPVEDGAEIIDPHGAGPRPSSWLDLDLEDVISALRDPAAAHLRTRLAVAVPTAPEEPERHLPLGVGGLEEHLLGTELLEAVRNGAEAAWRRDRPARGGLPPGLLADEALDRVAEEVVALRDLIPDTAEVEVRGVELHLRTSGPWSPTGAARSGGADRVRLTASLPRWDGRVVDVAFVHDQPREQVATWLRLLVAAHADPEDPWVEEGVVVRRSGRSRRAEPPRGPVRHELRIRGEDAAARAAVAGEALEVLVGLAALVRDVPLPFMPRASWWVGMPGAPAAAMKEALSRDAYSAASRLLLGVPTPEEFAAMHVRTPAGRRTAVELGDLLRATFERSVEVRTVLGGAA